MTRLSVLQNIAGSATCSGITLSFRTR
jgi:hypothetical protein